MKLIDFHNHFYPRGYLEALQQSPHAVEITFDDDGNPVLHSPGDKNYIVRGHRDIDVRREVVEAAGVDLQVLTFTAPGTLIETKERSVALARVVNDSLAEIVSEHSDRFTSLATLPLNDPAASVEELERCMTELGFPGAMVYGNVNGIALADERFWPLYERAAELGAVIFIHPTYPSGVEAMKEYWMMPLLGFTFDTTLAAAMLVFGGVADRFEGISWVLGHLGGAIPFLAERLDRGYEAFPDCREHLKRPPSEVLKTFYYDTVNFDPAALRLAIDFAGDSQIVAGSDYPHKIGSLAKMKESLAALDLEPAARERIMGGNAQRLLGL